MLKNKRIIFGIIVIIFMLVLAVTFIIIKPNKEETRNTCIVQFETSGGSKIKEQEVEKGIQVKRPDNPVKEGFTFVEWQLNGETFNFETLITEDIIITAKWTVNEGIITCIVSFDSDGGSWVNEIEVAHGSAISAPVQPIKEGYAFNGWYLNEEKYNFENIINENILLKAKWIKNEETLKKPETNNKTQISNESDNIENEIENSKEKYIYEKKDINTEYGGKIPEWQFDYKESTQIYSYFGFWSYDANTCKITYRTDNPDILKVNSEGIATGTGIGKTNLYICLVDKKNNKEIDCFTWIANVEYGNGTNAAKQDGEKLLNSLNGYYWYLDGYKYAYIKADVIPWYDHQALSWDSQYIEIENNTFVTTEQNGKNYQYGSCEIQNKFGINPIEFAYELIENYNMKVIGNKLYIQLGGKTYTFTKYNSKKNVTGTISLNKSNLTLNKGDMDSSIIAKISPFFASCDITVTSSNNRKVTCSTYSTEEGVFVINCFTWEQGDAIITVTDTIGGDSKKINVSVINKNINVNGITVNRTTLSLNKGSEEKLVATVSPENATNKNVIWTSSNISVATVDSNGKVTATGVGNATITAKTEDGGYSASCNVTVKAPPLKLDASIGVSTRVTNNGVSIGMVVNAKPSGGTGNYTYNIKLYYEGNLIGEGT